MIYQDTNLISNFSKITDQIGFEFGESEVEWLLSEYLDTKQVFGKFLLFDKFLLTIEFWN